MTARPNNEGSSTPEEAPAEPFRSRMWLPRTSKTYTEIYGREKWVVGTMRIVPLFGLVAFLATSSLLIGYVSTARIVSVNDAGWYIEGNDSLVHWLIGCWVFWVTVPPAWFAYEYFYLFDRENGKPHFEQFKYGQEIVSRAWATLVVVVGAFLYKSFK